MRLINSPSAFSVSDNVFELIENMPFLFVVFVVEVQSSLKYTRSVHPIRIYISLFTIICVRI